MTVLGLVADLLDPPERTAADVWLDYGWTAQNKQALAEALSRQVNEILYGGAVGGGKSEWLLLHLIAEMELHPGNRGLILRRDHPRLARSLLPRAEALLHGRASPNRNDHTFTFPNGSVLEFGHLQYEHSVFQYSGAEYGVIGFEEVTEFLEPQWDFLSTRLRAPVKGPQVHMVATTNPGNVGHRWVKRRWVKPKPEDVAGGAGIPKPGEVWEARPKADGQKSLRRVFVPSTIADNPILIERDPEYLGRMLATVHSRAMREALSTGDWDAIDAIEGALWDWPTIDSHCRDPGWPSGGAGGMVRVVVGVDPAATSGPDADETGIIVAGKGADGRFYVLDDRSIQGASPDEWGRRAVQAYRDHQADRVVAERNQGGDMVTHVLRTVDAGVPVKTVWASRGKAIRAEPVAALYEQGRVSHAGTFPELEEQLTTWTPESGDSPDRLDALVWALTELGVTGSEVEPVGYRNQALKGRR